jgi:hypothetical protein
MHAHAHPHPPTRARAHAHTTHTTPGLVQGADPWAVDKLGACTALHYAARGSHLELLQLLINAAGGSGPVHFPNRPNTK